MIQKQAIFHQANSNYAYAYDEKTVHIKLRTAKDDIKIASLLFDHPKGWEPDDNGVYHWYKQKIAMEKIATTALFDYWFIAVVPPNYNMRYGFVLEGNTSEERLLFIERGFFDLEDKVIQDDINSYFAFPYINGIDIFTVPAWVKKMQWYQIFPDRFAKDGTENENIVAWETQPPSNKVYYGGNLQGIIGKLDYLEELGVNGIYLTPIFKGQSVHKYDTIDYFEIDPCFGTKEDLQQLIEQMHKRGMKIMLDAVFNHIGSDAPQFQDVIMKGKNSKYYDWFYLESWPITDEAGTLLPQHYRNFAPQMPKLNTENPEVIEYLLSVATYWIKEFNIDAWRLDVANEVDHAFWRLFRQSVKKVKSDIYILGETWHDSTPWLLGEQFDGTMNYPLTKPIVEWLVCGHLDGVAFHEQLVKVLYQYSENIKLGMFNLLDSHDTPRLLYLARGNVERVMLAYTMLFLLPGSPCIFYGSEAGLDGGQDPLCRQSFPWNKDIQHTVLYQHLKKLYHLRKQEYCLGNESRLVFHKVTSDVLVFSKQTTTNQYLIILNGSESSYRLSVPEAFVRATPQRLLGYPINDKTITTKEITIEAFGQYIFKC